MTQNAFITCSWRFSDLQELELEKKKWILETYRKKLDFFLPAREIVHNKIVFHLQSCLLDSWDPAVATHSLQLEAVAVEAFW